MAEMPQDEDEEDEEDEEEEFTGTWDRRCREVCFDMQSKKKEADHFAKEVIDEMLKKNGNYITAKAPSGKTLLHWAAYAGCEITVDVSSLSFQSALDDPIFKTVFG